MKNSVTPPASNLIAKIQRKKQKWFWQSIAHRKVKENVDLKHIDIKIYIQNKEAR